MCNLYHLTTNQQAIRDILTLTHESIGNLEPSLDAYPDRPAPVVRNTWIRHWQQWLGVEHRCVLPATAFSEYGQAHDPAMKRKPLYWFARDQTHPLFFFTGIWTQWEGTRGSNRTPRPGQHELFAFLTTAPNALVKPVHPKAMPVVLTTREEVEVWLTADWRQAKALQRSLDDDLLELVERPVPLAG
ncbi:SOS response-associated peptidase [Xinfangfangia sp. D13-10-4-6]|nr:SOS response-associated peptidase [Pseudogemmobacter hezensis]